MLLELSGLSVCINGKEIVKDVTLEVKQGEVHVIMGPNGSGKSTLLSCIMGLPRVRACKGRIYYQNTDITSKPPYERATMGIALAHQSPPSIRGVKFAEVGKALVKKCGCSDFTFMTRILNVEELLNRELFVGYSGGERKRAEMLLVMLQAPKLALLDEPDSGVDIESLDLISNAINYLASRGSSIILVTHSGNILNKLARLDYVHIMLGGRIVYTGRPDGVLPIVFKLGYREGIKRLLGEEAVGG
uniref:ABC transporter ATP-binding protein n=1 Tax=Fervidicoccus fontis TaxID=683846 RepID=A0A7J3ZLY5_9CREN